MSRKSKKRTLRVPKRDVAKDQWGTRTHRHVQISPSNWCCGIYEGTLMDAQDNSPAIYESALGYIVDLRPSSVVWLSDFKGSEGATYDWVQWVRKEFPGTVRTLKKFVNFKTGHAVSMWVVNLDKIVEQARVVYV